MMLSFHSLTASCVRPSFGEATERLQAGA